jgi:hypothetical protein
MAVREQQLLKTPTPIAVSDAGNEMVVSDLQFQKAHPPIRVSDAGNVTVVREMHKLKAKELSIDVTNKGSVMDTRDLQLQKAS